MSIDENVLECKHIFGEVYTIRYTGIEDSELMCKRCDGILPMDKYLLFCNEMDGIQDYIKKNEYFFDDIACIKGIKPEEKYDGGKDERI